MAKFKPFDQHSEEYDSWFEENKNLYLSELRAVQELMPDQGTGLEIGVGTGRFAEPLNIKVGVEPSETMAQIARARGIEVVSGIAEDLPFQDDSFDYVLMVTVICFVDDVNKAFSEAYRVLKKDGKIIVAFIDKKSKLGQLYEKEKVKSTFYKEAAFYSTDEVIRYLTQNGFNKFETRQTIFDGQANGLQPVKIGSGEGSFMVVSAVKSV